MVTLNFWASLAHWDPKEGWVVLRLVFHLRKFTSTYNPSGGCVVPFRFPLRRYRYETLTTKSIDNPGWV